MRYYGVSVETVEEGLICLQNPNVKALQVIFNLFRQKPAEELFPQAHANGTGILVALPLASGLSRVNSPSIRRLRTTIIAILTGTANSSTSVRRSRGCHLKGVQLSRELTWIAEGRGNMTRARCDGYSIARTSAALFPASEIQPKSRTT